MLDEKHEGELMAYGVNKLIADDGRALVIFIAP